MVLCPLRHSSFVKKLFVFVFLIQRVLLVVFFVGLIFCSLSHQTLQAQENESLLTIWPIGVEEKILLGRYSPAKESGFVKVPSDMALRENQYLRKEVVVALQNLNAQARKNGFRIYVVSAVRNYWQQKYIWQAKFDGKRKTGGVLLSVRQSPQEKVDVILNFSSMPGTSRHHWGTDFDLFFSKEGVSLNNSAFEKGEGSRFYNWLTAVAPKFGFCQPYKNSPTQRRKGYTRGYLEEKWHWSYVPLSLPITQYAERHINKMEPKDFSGAEQGKKIYQEYILNIHPDCLP